MEEIRRWSHIYENGAPRFIEHYNSTTHKATIFVPERTCHDETKLRDFFTCSECHTPIGKWVPVYCPRCGAKVVEE